MLVKPTMIKAPKIPKLPYQYSVDPFPRSYIEPSVDYNDKKINPHKTLIIRNRILTYGLIEFSNFSDFYIQRLNISDDKELQWTNNQILMDQGKLFNDIEILSSLFSNIESLCVNISSTITHHRDDSIDTLYIFKSSTYDDEQDHDICDEALFMSLSIENDQVIQITNLNMSLRRVLSFDLNKCDVLGLTNIHHQCHIFISSYQENDSHIQHLCHDSITNTFTKLGEIEKINSRLKHQYLSIGNTIFDINHLPICENHPSENSLNLRINQSIEEKYNTGKIMKCLQYKQWNNTWKGKNIVNKYHSPSDYCMHFSCAILIKGGICLVFEHKFVYLIDLINSLINLKRILLGELCANVETIFGDLSTNGPWLCICDGNSYKDKNIVTGFIRGIVNGIDNGQIPPDYMLRLMSNYYCAETIYLYRNLNTMNEFNYYVWKLNVDDIINAFRGS